jgi:hypothetical protein
LNLQFLIGDKVKTTKYLTVITAALFILGTLSACSSQNTETKNTPVNQPAANSAANANQTPANKTEANKAETDKPASSSSSSLATPSDAYKAAYTARQKKDMEGLKKVMSKDALEFFTMMGDGKSPDEGLKQLIERPQAATAETRSEKIDGDKATLEYLNEKGGWGPMDFVKEDGGWKLTIPKPEGKISEDKGKK